MKRLNCDYWKNREKIKSYVNNRYYLQGKKEPLIYLWIEGSFFILAVRGYG